MQIYKDIEGYIGYYQVNANGTVRSLPRSIIKKSGIKYESKGRILNPGVSKAGYPIVILCADNIRKGFSVHRLVAKAFIGNPLNLPAVNHKNGIKTDNRVENLEWCNYSQNIIHAFENGLFKPSKRKNDFNHKSIPVLQYSLTNEFISEYPSLAEAARITGADSSLISRCCIGKRNKTGNYKWKFKTGYKFISLSNRRILKDA